MSVKNIYWPINQCFPFLCRKSLDRRRQYAFDLSVLLCVHMAIPVETVWLAWWCIIFWSLWWYRLLIKFRQLICQTEISVKDNNKSIMSCTYWMLFVWQTICHVACVCTDCICENWRRCDNVCRLLSWTAEVRPEGRIDKLRGCILHWPAVSTPG